MSKKVFISINKLFLLNEKSGIVKAIGNKSDFLSKKVTFFVINL